MSPWCVVGDRVAHACSCPIVLVPPPTIVLLVLPVEKSSIIIVGFCIVHHYRVIVAIMLPLSHWSLGADICHCCSSEFCAPMIHPGAVGFTGAGGDGLGHSLVIGWVISHLWLGHRGGHPITGMFYKPMKNKKIYWVS